MTPLVTANIKWRKQLVPYDYRTFEQEWGARANELILMVDNNTLLLVYYNYCLSEIKQCYLKVMKQETVCNCDPIKISQNEQKYMNTDPSPPRSPQMVPARKYKLKNIDLDLWHCRSL